MWICKNEEAEAAKHQEIGDMEKMLQINYNYESRQGHLAMLINKYSNLSNKQNYADPFNSYIVQANARNGYSKPEFI